jgi:hypothetical protein
VKSRGSSLFRTFRFAKPIPEPTSGLEPLTSSHYESACTRSSLSWCVQLPRLYMRFSAWRSQSYFRCVPARISAVEVHAWASTPTQGRTVSGLEKAGGRGLQQMHYGSGSERESTCGPMVRPAPERPLADVTHPPPATRRSGSLPLLGRPRASPRTLQQGRPADAHVAVPLVG